MSSFRFLHCADLHLDSPMRGLRARGEVREGLFDGATRRAFTRLIDLALDHDVAFVLIAGDVYDEDWRDHRTGLFFNDQIRRLRDRPVFIVRGNHDAASVITKQLTTPANAHIFATDRAETVTLPDLGVALHGQSFATRAVTDNLARNYPPPVPGLLNIGLLHTALENTRHARYAPCSVADLVARGYDYWALGHVHDREDIRPPAGPIILFPGNIQGRGVHEPGDKGGTIVTVDRGRVTDLAHHATDVLRWADLRVPLDAATDTPELRARVTDALAGFDPSGPPVVARLRLHGRTALHAALLADRDALAAECADAAAILGEHIELERVLIETTPLGPAAADDEQLDLLATAFLAGLDDASIRDELLRTLATLARDAKDADLPRDEAGLRALAAECWPAIAHALAT